MLFEWLLAWDSVDNIILSSYDLLQSGAGSEAGEPELVSGQFVQNDGDGVLQLSWDIACRSVSMSANCAAAKKVGWIIFWDVRGPNVGAGVVPEITWGPLLWLPGDMSKPRIIKPHFWVFFNYQKYLGMYHSLQHVHTLDFVGFQITFSLILKTGSWKCQIRCSWIFFQSVIITYSLLNLNSPVLMIILSKEASILSQYVKNARIRRERQTYTFAFSTLKWLKLSQISSALVRRFSITMVIFDITFSPQTET